MKPISALLLGFGLACSLQAQAPAQPPLRFEVASIRPSAPVTQQVNIGLHMDGMQARIVSLSVRDYVAMAYKTRSYLISGPEWIEKKHFDISATMPEGAKVSEIDAPMKALLAERFGLKTHTTQKEVQVYVLTRGKRPLALQKSAVADAAPSEAVTIAAQGSGQGVSVNLGRGASYTFANNKFEGKKLDMKTLTDSLTIYLNLPVIDQTGLEGFYDVTLDITADDYRAMLLHAAMINGVVLPPQMQQMVDTATLPSLFDAFDRAGLKLESRKVPFDVVVVDAILETPTEN
jgi:uncharacterized protein (TIGR03435 family)